jgi:L-lactate dehydrogenase complex protein LldG
MAPDPLLDRADWGAGDGGRATLEVRRGTAAADDQVGVTTAFAGVAETGTVMLVSGPDNPAMLGFLPETCVVVLPAGRVVGAYEEGWRRLREAYGGAPPRAVTFVTGPSRTADIEQTLQLGAHGPQRLLVLVVDEDDGERRPAA